MNIMFFENIYAQKGTLKTIHNVSELVSNIPKDRCPLYGAFVSDGFRKIPSIKYRTAITVDIDKLDCSDIEARDIVKNIIDYLNSLFFSWILHETHSSKEDDRRIRIIIPTPNISTKNYKFFAEAFFNDFNDKLNQSGKIIIDNKSYEPQQLMYLIPHTAKIMGRLDGENNCDWIIEEAKKLVKQEPPKRVFLPRETNGDNFYDWLNGKGMRYWIDRFFQDKYRYNRELANGEAEYKDLNSKKRAGVRITKNDQVIVSWHDGDEYMEDGNGVKRANIYQMLKSKDLIPQLLEEWKAER